MKYVKPEAEIVDLENEDIIVASRTADRSKGGPCYGTNGIIGSPNNADYMGCSGSGSFGYGGACAGRINGLTCTGTNGWTICGNSNGTQCPVGFLGTHKTYCTPLVGIN